MLPPGPSWAPQATGRIAEGRPIKARRARLTVRWLLRWPWWRLAVWQGLVVLAAVAGTEVALLVNAPLEEGRLQPGRRWGLQGWYWPWFLGAYVTSCAMSTLLPGCYGLPTA
jgi:hypothetical protein